MNTNKILRRLKRARINLIQVEQAIAKADDSDPISNENEELNDIRSRVESLETRVDVIEGGERDDNKHD